jgi:hypothetical protein
VPEQSAVVELAAYVERRDSRVSAALRDAQKSQAVFSRIVDQATAARRRHFRAALEAGATVEAIAYHAEVERDEVREIVR